MNNFINVRITPYNHYKEKNDIKHNLDTVNKQSRVDSAFKNYKNRIINYQDKPPLDTLREWRAEHNKRYKARRRENLTNSNSTILNGVITFSEAIKTDLGTKYTRENFEQVCKDTIEEIAEYLGTSIMYVAFHYNEKTPHAQYHLKNYDNEGRSIYYKYRKKEHLSRLQDIAFKHFKKLGMDRGISKEITNKTHQTTKQYYSKQYAEAQSTLRSAVAELKALREEISNLDMSMEEKKFEYSKISEEQKTIRLLDKLLTKAKKKILLTQDEAEKLREHLPRISDLVPVEKKKQIAQTVNNALMQTQNNKNLEPDL